MQRLPRAAQVLSVRSQKRASPNTHAYPDTPREPSLHSLPEGPEIPLSPPSPRHKFVCTVAVRSPSHDTPHNTTEPDHKYMPLKDIALNLNIAPLFSHESS